MKVSDPKRATQAYKGQERRSASSVAPVSAAEPRSLLDRATVMGIPEGEFTPAVEKAVIKLMEEVDRLRRDLENSNRRAEELETVADEDPLVPVLNRRAFERELARSMAFSRRYEADASIIYFDLDDFKRINDRFGHAAGDQALKHVGLLLSDNVRQSDIVGRLGGDEFAVVLAQTTAEFARAKAGKLAELIARTPVEFEGNEIRLSASAGTASLKAGEDGAAVLAEADRAMYREKAGRQPS